MAAVGRSVSPYSEWMITPVFSSRDERPSHRGCDLPAQRRDVTRPVGMDTIGQEYDEDLRHRIDPDRGARKPRVAERPDRQQLAAVGGEGRIDVPPEPALLAMTGRT